MVTFVAMNLLVGVSCFVHPIAYRPSSFMPHVTRDTKSSLLTCSPVIRDSSKRASPRMKVELGPDETVEKYGLEAGLFKTLTKKEGGEGNGKMATAQELLKRYGSAYLITSISLAIVSFGICYVAVSNGVDMASLLSKFGIESSASAETTSTLAVAYAIHKAASPIRFPPTVALTPVVAKFLGKEANEEPEAAGK